MSARIPKVALIGRTNVGKSTLFNKLIEEEKSLVSPIAGTTRDRFEADCLWRGAYVRLVDTGGRDVDTRDPIERGIVEQSDIAIREADVILFVVDVMVGPTEDDRMIAKKLHAAGKPVIVVGNKADNTPLRMSVEGEAWRGWPLPRPLPVSANQGMGTGDLLDAVYDILPTIGATPAAVPAVRPMQVGVFGEPNVGKSTLLNALLGEKRFLASPVAHTTRQPNDVVIERAGTTYIFVDTAGIRRQARRNQSGTVLEKHGVEKTIDMLERCQVALFVIDSSQSITAQDRHLAGLMAEHGVSVIIIANKWDLIPDKEANTITAYEEYIRAHLPQISYAPIIFTSALSGQRVNDLFDVITTVYASRFTELSDEETKTFISRAIARHKPSKNRGTWHPRVTSFLQTRANPPTFVLTINQPREDALAPSYIRFLENRLREQYDFIGTPIRIRVKALQHKHSAARE